MVVLAGASSFFVGNAFQAQMPEYAHFLGADDTGARYSILLAAHAAGAVIGVIVLESVTLVQPSVRATIVFAALWALSMGLFPMTGNYPLAVLLLVVAGIFSIAFTSMAQTLVQILAPPAIRGTIVGLFNTAMLGLRAGSGITVGVLGAFIGVRLSLELSSLMVIVVSVVLFVRRRDMSVDRRPSTARSPRRRRRWHEELPTPKTPNSQKRPTPQGGRWESLRELDAELPTVGLLGVEAIHRSHPAVCHTDNVDRREP